MTTAPLSPPVPILPWVKVQLIVNVVLVFITTLVVALRVFTRRVTGSKLRWDDYLILASLPLNIAMVICEGLLSTAGVGYPEGELNEDIKYIVIVVSIFEILYNITIITTKLSVLFHYLRVFNDKFMRWATIGMMVTLLACGLANLLLSVFVCHIHDGRVDFQDMPQCAAQSLGFLASGIFNSTANFIISLLPLYTIWTLKRVSVSTRMGLTAIFLLGINVTWVSAVRISYLVQMGTTTQPYKLMAFINFFTILEVSLSILCNSLPTLLPLYSYWRYRRFYGEGEDEYVARMNESDGTGGIVRHKFLVASVANGLPLETIYGKDNIHFTASVGAGEQHQLQPCSRERTRALTPDDGWETESTRRLSRNAGVITIETKWSITESRQSTFGLD